MLMAGTAHRGLMFGLDSLGVQHDEGEGLQKDPVRAVRLFEAR